MGTGNSSMFGPVVHSGDKVESRQIGDKVDYVDDLSPFCRKSTVAGSFHVVDRDAVDSGSFHLLD